MEKTFEECCDEVAKNYQITKQQALNYASAHYGYNDFEEAKKENSTKWMPLIIDFAISHYAELLLKHRKEAAKLYCQSQKAKAWVECYEATKELTFAIGLSSLAPMPSNPYKP